MPVSHNTLSNTFYSISSLPRVKQLLMLLSQSSCHADVHLFTAYL
uniref:Uncharacterized protein n=1 Tax=Arundo donax TaxID=35708 RepID=A0A0A9D7I4_ARUDO